MKKIVITMLAAIMALSMVLSGCSKEKEDTTPKTDEATTAADVAATDATEAPATNTVAAADMVVGFIYVGPIGDGGFTYAHDQGRLAIEKELGVKTIYKESVPEGPEVEKVMRDMVAEGANVIFATSFGFMDYVENVAKEFPEVKFYHCSGYKDGPNFINYFGRIEQARYLSGIVAGMKTVTNQIGYVAAFEIPEVIRGIDAFTLGAQSVNPDVVVNVRWTHTWYDPVSEKQAAVALIDEGCDVIAQHQDTAGPQQAAEEAGVWSVGYNTDMSGAAPTANLTSAAWNWGPYYVAQVKSVMDGTWVKENYWGGLNEDVVLLTPLTKNAPDGAQAKVDEVLAKIKDGSFNIFQGPLLDQTGTEKIAAGAAMSDGDQLGLMWFVKGVNGVIEQ